jgi:hypothetical protein
MSHFATDEEEKKRLKLLASHKGRERLYWYYQKESLTVLEVMPSPYIFITILLQYIHIR